MRYLALLRMVAQSGYVVPLKRSCTKLQTKSRVEGDAVRGGPSSDELPGMAGASRDGGLRLEVGISYIPAHPNVPLLRALWSLLDGIWDV